MPDWTPYTGNGEPQDLELPEPPPWRRFDGAGPAGAEGATFRAMPEIVEAVNAALVLRRPLLVTGRPGSGKSSLIESVARELRLGPVLRWHVTSRSTRQDALYRYDAIARLQAHTLEQQVPAIGRFLRLGPLGTALLPSPQPRALLIDEVDKGDIDLPNDLLDVFERGEFEIPELARLEEDAVEIREHASDTWVSIERGQVRCTEFPFVVLTSNGEREFPPAFLRRCIRLRMADPTPALLTEIVEAHLGADAAGAAQGLIVDFAARARESGAMATDQLINAVFMTSGMPDGPLRARVVELLLKELNADQ